MVTLPTKLRENYTGHSGVPYVFEYVTTDTIAHLEPNKITQCYAVCFYGKQVVIVYNGHKQQWGMIGGTPEPNEPPSETLRREIREEANMRLLDHQLLGYQKVTDTRDGSYVYQLRYFCTAEPYGTFESDPDGTVTKIAIINPAKYKDYFDWGAIGDTIIRQAIDCYKHRLD
jgi:8-oxo-dGTP pyrophosphatase MutT (NUDIX family)